MSHIDFNTRKLAYNNTFSQIEDIMIEYRNLGSQKDENINFIVKGSDRSVSAPDFKLIYFPKSNNLYNAIKNIPTYSLRAKKALNLTKLPESLDLVVKLYYDFEQNNTELKIRDLYITSKQVYQEDYFIFNTEKNNIRLNYLSTLISEKYYNPKEFDKHFSAWFCLYKDLQQDFNNYNEKISQKIINYFSELEDLEFVKYLKVLNNIIEGTVLQTK